MNGFCRKYQTQGLIYLEFTDPNFKVSSTSLSQRTDLGRRTKQALGNPPGIFPPFSTSNFIRVAPVVQYFLLECRVINKMEIISFRAWQNQSATPQRGQVVSGRYFYLRLVPLPSGIQERKKKWSSLGSYFWCSILGKKHNLHVSNANRHSATHV